MPEIRDNPARTIYTDLVIADGETKSEALECKGTILAGILIPTGFDGTIVSFEESFDKGVTYLPIRDASGALITMAVTAGSIYRIAPSDFSSTTFFKIVSGTAQTVDTTLRVATKAY